MDMDIYYFKAIFMRWDTQNSMIEKYGIFSPLGSKVISRITKVRWSNSHDCRKSKPLMVSREKHKFMYAYWLSKILHQTSQFVSWNNILYTLRDRTNNDKTHKSGSPKMWTYSTGDWSCITSACRWSTRCGIGAPAPFTAIRFYIFTPSIARFAFHFWTS